jgi:hypothetical protein
MPALKSSFAFFIASVRLSETALIAFFWASVKGLPLLSLLKSGG